jgi:xanthine dehydrogenase YagT iron-sulfur-binding subunit
MTERPTLTRRGLFRSLGTAAVVSGCTRPDPEGPITPDDRAQGEPDVLGPAAAPLSFTLDGRTIRASAEPRTSLLELLRLDLDQTGTKLVCDRGACGACMVLIDGLARNACMTLAHDVEGCEVTTVAGLAESGRLSKLQSAFVEHDALQCGFCTSGMLISATALLELRTRAGNATTLQAEEVRKALAGNLCRCGTYPHVISAVLAAAGSSGSPPPSRSEILTITKAGKPLSPRKEPA